MKKVLIASLIVVSLLFLASGAMADYGNDRGKWDDHHGDKCAPECPPEETPKETCPPCPPIVINIPECDFPDMEIELPEPCCFPDVVVNMPEINCPDISFDFPDLCPDDKICPEPCPEPAPCPDDKVVDDKCDDNKRGGRRH